MAQGKLHTRDWIILPGTTVGGEVGTFKADFVIRNRADTGRSQALSGVVDTGASYTVVPATILDALGVEQEQSINFTLADGSKRDMDIGWVQMELEGRTGHVYVVFGPDNSPVLLGAMALETFALAADAKNRCLVPGQATL
jgi:predicted aspartyl protease